MWLNPTDLVRLEGVSEMIGRAMLVCQKFELTCKDIITWFEIVFSLQKGEQEFMSNDYIDFVDKLHGLLLGQTLWKLEKHKQQKFLDVSTETLGILNSARVSRNWIAHESGCIPLFNPRQLETFKKELKDHIANVAKGDFIVSTWSYEFHEKERSHLNEESYIESLVSWVAGIADRY